MFGAGRLCIVAACAKRAEMSDPPYQDGAPVIEERGVDWVDLLRGADDHGPPWVRLSPERVAVMGLDDCAAQLERAVEQIDFLALAAKSIHMALQAALTAALAGTANIGAHPPKLRIAHLAHLEGRGSGPLRPVGDKVMGFADLLAAATSQPLPWSGAPLPLDDEAAELLGRLTEVRHAVEHPKQILHSIEPRYVAEALPVAADLAYTLLESVFHHLGPGEVERIGLVAVAIRRHCASFLSNPD